MSTEDGTAPAAPTRAARLRWPMIIVGLLMGHVGAMALALHVAMGDAGNRNGNKVIPDYYEKAVHWDDERAAQRASDTLGWTVRPAVSVFTDGAGLRPLTITVTDEAGAPVEGLVLAAELWHHAVGQPVEVDFAKVEGAAGTYRAQVPMDRAGTWECDLVDRREGSVFRRALTLDVAPLGDGR